MAPGVFQMPILVPDGRGALHWSQSETREDHTDIEEPSASITLGS